MCRHGGRSTASLVCWPCIEMPRPCWPRPCNLHCLPPLLYRRKDAQRPAFPPADGGIKASRVAPAPLGACDGLPPPAVAAFPMSSVRHAADRQHSD